MKFIKNFLLIALFCFSANLFAQARVEFTTTAVTMSGLQNNGKWSDFPKFKPTQFPIKFDFEKNRIVLYSEIEQVYRIGEYYKEEETKDEFINFFRCLSSNGETTEITLKTSKTENASQMYIKDKSRVLIYNMKQVSNQIKKSSK